MSPILRRRLIEANDLAAVAALLAVGFPQHSRGWWNRALDRLRLRESPNGYPRYGRLLEMNGQPVGVLLTIHSEVADVAGGTFVRCNLSSWYVDEAFSGHAPLLLGAALRDRSVTYLNISPALHTQPIIEAQGFRPFAAGSLATLPILASRTAQARVRRLKEGEIGGGIEGRLLAEHSAFGCLCLIVEAADGEYPFVFSTTRKVHRLFPATQLLYCRDVAHYVRFAGVLGATLLRHGSALTFLDGPRSLPGVPCRQVFTRQKRYVVGPHPPRPGDLAYTELAIFH